MIDLDSKSLSTVISILQQYAPNIEVRVFGSRVTGGARKFSDLDLVLDAGKPIPISQMNELKFAFSNSDLPIMVDIVDRAALSDEFKSIIDVANEVLIQI